MPSLSRAYVAHVCAYGAQRAAVRCVFPTCSLRPATWPPCASPPGYLGAYQGRSSRPLAPEEPGRLGTVCFAVRFLMER